MADGWLSRGSVPMKCRCIWILIKKLIKRIIDTKLWKHVGIQIPMKDPHSKNYNCSLTKFKKPLLMKFQKQGNIEKITDQCFSKDSGNSHWIKLSYFFYFLNDVELFSRLQNTILFHFPGRKVVYRNEFHWTTLIFILFILLCVPPLLGSPSPQGMQLGMDSRPDISEFPTSRSDVIFIPKKFPILDFWVGPGRVENPTLDATLFYK